jgi:hypothetical protein
MIIYNSGHASPEKTMALYRGRRRQWRRLLLPATTTPDVGGGKANEIILVWVPGGRRGGATAPLPSWFRVNDQLFQLG